MSGSFLCDIKMILKILNIDQCEKNTIYSILQVHVLFKSNEQCNNSIYFIKSNVTGW